MSALLDPPETTLDPLVQEVLDWVNGERQRRGLETCDDLARGVPGATSCPVALALGGAFVTKIYMRYYESRYALGEKVGLPPAVQEFIRQFDGGGYGQYRQRFLSG